jgi:uncharacterized membrane protein HdeD (DUF308 family)
MPGRPPTPPVFDLFGLGPDESHRDWQPFLGWGLTLVTVGLAAAGAALASGPESAWVFGVVLFAGGLVQVATAVRAWAWGGLRPRALAGVVYLVAGGVIAGLPSTAAVWFPLLLATALVIGGAVRTGGAVAERFTGRRLVLTTGLAAVAIGALVGQEWPDAGLWVVGLPAGIDLFAGGLGWVSFALGLRTAPTVV